EVQSEVTSRHQQQGGASVQSARPPRFVFHPPAAPARAAHPIGRGCYSLLLTRLTVAPGSIENARKALSRRSQSSTVALASLSTATPALALVLMRQPRNVGLPFS